MVYEYVLTFQDYRNAQRLYLRHRKMAAIYFYFWIWVLPISGLLVGILFAIAMLSGRTEGMAAYAGLAAGGVWLACFIPTMQWYGRRKIWKQLIPPEIETRSAKTAISVSLEFNESQLISTIPGRSEGRFFWPAILDFAENDQVAILFIHKKQFLFVPKRALPEFAWADLRKHLASTAGGQ